MENNRLTVFNSQEEVNNYLKSNSSNHPDIILENSEFNFPYEFSNTVYNEISFAGSTFNYDQSFNNIEFEKSVNFSNCTFKKKVEFIDSTFKDKLNINNSEFFGEVSFDGAKFDGKFNGWELIFHKNVTFLWANFNEKANLTHMKVTNGIANFKGVFFDKNFYLNNGDFKELDLKRSIINSASFVEVKIKKVKRETCRIIKNEFLKQNNRIEALKFHRKEMRAYWSELSENLSKPKSIKSFFGNLGDIFILSLNAISNGYGTWWSIGLIFTFLTTSLMYLWFISYIQVCPKADLSFWKYYPQFISPIHKIDFIENATLTDGAYVIDFIGRIVSSFGIYQTIQAFRKFGRF